MDLKLGRKLIQLYGVLWIVFALVALVSWDMIASSEVTTIPDVLELVFGAYTPIATFVMLGALGYGLLTFRGWVRYLFTAIFILSLILPPYEFTEMDIVSALFDVLILYLIWFRKDTAGLFKRQK